MQYGRPFIILREQGKKTRSHGVQAIKVSGYARNFDVCLNRYAIVTYSSCANSG